MTAYPVAPAAADIGTLLAALWHVSAAPLTYPRTGLSWQAVLTTRAGGDGGGNGAGEDTWGGEAMDRLVELEEREWFLVGALEACGEVSIAVEAGENLR